jgi:predicted TIM-barrel fold metal-dependent hydrolase
MSKITVISSDGHVAARMRDYRPYLDAPFVEDFDGFVSEYEKHGVATSDPTSIAERLDPETAKAWMENVADQGRLDAIWNPERRLVEMEREGITAEVLFQDFATPFMMSSPTRAAVGQSVARASADHLSAGFRAYNRWVADFCSVAPERWRGMAAISFHDLEAAVKDVHEAKGLGFAGIALPAVPDTDRLYQEEYDPIWTAMEDLDLVLNVHVAIANDIPTYRGAPSLTSGRALVSADIFAGARQVLPILIFGGVLERFPRLKVAFTETQSDWVLGMLARMNHTFERSDLKRDIRDIVPLRPSDYWQRQCFIGSSIFSRAEIAARDRLGVDKMMIGMDFPHSEGAWRHGTLAYLKATFGTEHVPAADAQLMLNRNAASLYGFNLVALDAIAGEVGLDLEDVLTAPAVQPSLRGDLDRPLVSA